MKRRDLLLGGMSLAALNACGGAGRARVGNEKVPLTTENANVLIIGSGFGGGVSALRLSQAGIKCTVLERGKWWPAYPNCTTFPTVATGMDERLLWYGNPAGPSAYNAIASVYGGAQISEDGPLHAGVLDPRADANMTVFVPAGVGGGSLLYQGMTLMPDENVFYECFPSAFDYAEMSSKYYPRVAGMLQVQVAPDELIAHDNYRVARFWKERAEAAGFSVEKIPMPIDWSYALRELQGEMAPAYTNGDNSFGVNNGGKHSVDVTYIQQAMATGMCQVNALHDVTRIRRAGAEQWEVSVNVTDESGRILEQKLISAKSLILAAGSVGTTQLLQRAQFYNDIPDLPDQLGQNWGTNGDRIFYWNAPLSGWGPVTGGPVVYGSKEWGDAAMANTVIQASMPATGTDPTLTTVVGYGVSKTRGRWIYDPVTDKSHLVWPREGDLGLHQRIIQRAQAIAGIDSILIDSHIEAPMTWHPLGGANMEVVCDLEGRVHDQKGLYVLDGALMPGTTAACNPSMTIAAMAERAIERIIRDDLLT